MPLLPSGCGMDNNLAIDVHNEVSARSHGCSHPMALSARHCHIINPGRFLTGGPSKARRRDRGAVSLQYWSPSMTLLLLQIMSPVSGFWRGVNGKNMIAQQTSSDISSDPNEWSHSWAIRGKKINKSIKINNDDGETTPLCWEKIKLTKTGWLDVTIRTKNNKMNEMA